MPWFQEDVSAFYSVWKWTQNPVFAGLTDVLDVLEDEWRNKKVFYILWQDWSGKCFMDIEFGLVPETVVKVVRSSEYGFKVHLLRLLRLSF